jgi:hypothetical protein
MQRAILNSTWQSTRRLDSSKPYAAGCPRAKRPVYACADPCQPRELGKEDEMIAVGDARHCESLHEQLETRLQSAGIDMRQSGLRFLPEEAQLKILEKSNKFEKIKAEKCGSVMWTEVSELAELIRRGETTWENLDLDDIDVRLKWAGLFHRRKRTPGKFMMRLKVPNGELDADQLRVLGECIAGYGDAGCGDITTRANIQLRGIPLEDADLIIDKLKSVGLSSFMSGMDNIRNITGSPIAGIDPHEVLDSRPLVKGAFLCPQCSLCGLLGCLHKLGGILTHDLILLLQNLPRRTERRDHQ